MSKIDTFFREMKSLFLKSDYDAYEGIKENLLEHITVKLSEGLTEDEILKELDTPKDIVSEFYEDKRLYKAMQYETDIVAIEDVQDVALQAKKEKLYSYYLKLNHTFRLLFRFILCILISIQTIYIVHDILLKSYFNVLSALIIIWSIFGLILTSRKIEFKRWLGRIGWIIIIIALFFILHCLKNGHLKYEGEAINKEISFNNSDWQSFVLKNNNPTNVTILPTKDNKTTIQIKGYIHKRSEKNLKDILKNKKINLNIGQYNLFDKFNNIKPVDLIIFLPESKQKTLKFDLKKGHIQTNYIKTKSIDVSLEQGEFNGETIEANNIKFDGSKADIIFNRYNTNLSIKNDYGRTILKHGKGNMDLKMKRGLAILTKVTSKKQSALSETGKLVFTNTAIDNLDIQGNENVVILENQTGNNKLDLNEGKFVATNIHGNLSVNNDNADVIIRQNNSLNGEIVNNTGTIKWIQNTNKEKGKIKFNINSREGYIINKLEEQNSASYTSNYSITTNTGPVGLYSDSSVY